MLASIRRTRCALKAPITTPVGTGFRSINVHLRQEFDLYACVRPCKYYPGVRTFFSHVPVDLVIVRENTEDLYAGIEFEQGKPDTAELIDYINRISTGPEDQDRPRRDRRVDQADQRLGHGADRPLRLRVRPRQRPQEGHGRPQGQHHEAHRRPVPGHRPARWPRSSPTSSSRTASSTTCACSWCRSRSSTTCWCCRTSTATSSATWRPGWSAGWAWRPGRTSAPTRAVFEATHGSAPKYKGQNKVNPTALILSGVLMLRHLKETEAADRLERAVAAVIAEGRDVTYDMKPNRDDPTAVGTREMADAICRQLTVGA